MFGTPSHDLIKVHCLQLFRHRAPLTTANDPAVEFSYRQYFGCSASKEGFVRNIHLITGNSPFGNR